MKRRRHDSDASEPLWKRVLGRYGFSGVALRPRVPLVLLRQRRAERIAPAARAGSGSPAPATLRVNLHVLLDWPRWLRPDGRRGRSSDRTATGSGRRRSRDLAAGSGSPLATTHHRDSPSLPARAGQPIAGGSPQAAIDSTSMVSAPTRARAGLPRAIAVGSAPGSIVDGGRSPGRVPRAPASPRRALMSYGRGRDAAHDGGGGVTPSVSRGAGFRHRTVASSHSAVRPPLSPRAFPDRDESRPRDRWSARVAPTHLRQPSSLGEAGQALEPAASRVLAKPSRVMAQTTQAAEPEVRGPERPTTASQPGAPAPPLPDIARLSDEVYRHIQRKLRIERERRGL